MKRLFQIVLRPVAAAVIALVAMQPAVAGIVCGAPSAPCPLAIADTSPHCGAVSKADLDGSQSIPRVRPIPRTMASVALPATRKVLALAAAGVPAEAAPAPRPVFLAHAQSEAKAKSPPIYLRNRVFRI